MFAKEFGDDAGATCEFEDVADVMGGHSFGEVTAVRDEHEGTQASVVVFRDRAGESGIALFCHRAMLQTDLGQALGYLVFDGQVR